MEEKECGLCGEPFKLDADGFPSSEAGEEVGEFGTAEGSVVAHAQCGLDAGLAIA
ncbi:hypothetical protein [Actinomadura nitritigenes]|uniref:hypothetical protein n=1 Tax=Actinomadura nitritigenes TaxID=134602 RepID=UPI003D8C0405